MVATPPTGVSRLLLAPLCDVGDLTTLDSEVALVELAEAVLEPVPAGTTKTIAKTSRGSIGLPAATWEPLATVKLLFT